MLESCQGLGCAGLQLAVERKSFGKLTTVTSQEAPFLCKPLDLALSELVSSCIMGH